MKRLVFYGNCQAADYGNVYKMSISPSTGDHVTIIEFMSRMTQDDLAAVAEADLYVSQLFDIKHHNNMASFSPATVALQFPVFYFEGTMAVLRA